MVIVFSLDRHAAQRLVERPRLEVILQHPDDHCLEAVCDQPPRHGERQRAADALTLVCGQHVEAVELAVIAGYAIAFRSAGRGRNDLSAASSATKTRHGLLFR